MLSPGGFFEFLRSTYLPLAKSPETPRPKLYISRSRARFRRV